jgi:biopolymer transport protein ExbD
MAAPLPSLSAEPNVIPMIDILLVLLIIFMLINVVQVREVHELHLPQEARGGEAAVPVVVEVLPGNTFAINRDPVTADALHARLTGIYAGRPDKTLLVKGHPRVRYQDVYTAIGVARGAGVLAIGIAPQDPGER